MTRRKKENSFLRFMFTNGISATSLVAVIYYAGVITEKNETQSKTLTEVQTTVEATSDDVQEVRTDIAVVKTRVDTLEKRERVRDWVRERDRKTEP